MPSSIERLIARRVEGLPQGLQEHIYRAQIVAHELARRHQVDEEKARLGTLAHDIARSMNGNQLLQRALELGVPVHPVERQVPVLLHGPVGAELLRRMDGLDDDDIYQAVRWHSTGHQSLTDPAKVVFLADKLDPQKVSRYRYLPRVNELAMESLDEAILEFLSQGMASLIQAGSLVHPASIEARNELLMALGQKRRGSSADPASP